MPKLRALVFAAVSTEEQAGVDCPSLDEQAARAEAACRANEWPIAARVRVEGHSRDYTRLDLLCRDSPAYASLIEWIESGQINLLVCNDYDRLWRTDALRAQVAAVCRDAGVHIYSVTYSEIQTKGGPSLQAAPLYRSQMKNR